MGQVAGSDSVSPQSITTSTTYLHQTAATTEAHHAQEIAVTAFSFKGAVTDSEQRPMWISGEQTSKGITKMIIDLLYSISQPESISSQAHVQRPLKSGQPIGRRAQCFSFSPVSIALLTLVLCILHPCSRRSVLSTVDSLCFSLKVHSKICSCSFPCSLPLCNVDHFHQGQLNS